MFVIVPRRTNQRDSTRQRLEGSYRRDAGQRLHIRSPRYVNRQTELRKDFRHPIVRKPARVLDAASFERAECVLRITNSVDPRREPEIVNRLEQVFVKL